jgi:hypothetical protein
MAMWESMIVGLPGSGGRMESALEALTEVFASLAESPRSRFRSNRDRELFDLTKHLSDWCIAEPPSRDRLTRFQARIARVSDADLRNLLLAPVAAAWLQLRDVSRTSHLAQLAGPGPLVKAGFYDSLRSHVQELCSSQPWTDLPSYKELVLDLVLLTPFQVYDEALEDTVTSWISLRAKELATTSGTAEQMSYLQKLVGWIISVANEGASKNPGST